MEEFSKTLEALKLAVRMEIDGKEFYLKSSQNSRNDLGRQLFQSLAAEEDLHRLKFEEIYQALSSRKDWPVVDFQPDKGKHLRTLFARATREIGTKVKSSTSELDAIKTAMDMENQSYDLYEGRAKHSDFTGEKEFFNTVAGEERGHYLIILDYYEYLTAPAAWFVKQERHSLDGG